MSTNGELIKYTIEEFSWLQDCMEVADKDSEVYRRIKKRYKALKSTLQSLSVNLDEIDYIKE